MTIVRQLLEKPWEPSTGAVLLHGGRSFQLPVETVALRVFLVVVTVLFSLLVSAYGVRMAFEDWRPAPEQWLLWVNTGFLVLSSAAFHLAWTAVRDGRLERARLGLWLAGGLALAFLLGQVQAWRHLEALGAFDVTNPAIAFFYLITGLHALHLAGGLVAWAVTLGTLSQRAPLRVERRVRLCATYWHYLLGLWIVLFALLFSGNENLDIILSICGLR